MTDRPIIFSGAMVRALLEGRKTMTRRLLKLQHDASRGDVDQNEYGEWFFWKDGEPGASFDLPYAVGDRLYVRESYRPNDMAPESWEQIIWRADCKPEAIGPWKPAIHLPKRRSRITLTVEAVKVERLQNISAADCYAEGVSDAPREGRSYLSPYGGSSVVNNFVALWQSLNAKRAPWDSNPWVVAVSFAVIKANIDSLKSEAA